MPDPTRLIVALLLAMAIGAMTAAAMLVIPGQVHLSALLALGCWVHALLLFVRGVERENPSELAAAASAAIGLSCAAVGYWLRRDEGALPWLLLAASFLLILAAFGFRHRAITRKRANRRKAQSA